MAITGVAGGEREATMGSAAAEGPSLQVRGRWIKMAGALPRPASCVCVLLFSLLLCTRVRVVLVVVAAAVEFAVVSLSLSLYLFLSFSLSLSIKKTKCPIASHLQTILRDEFTKK